MGARKKLNSAKDELRSVQNLHTKRMDESDPPPGVSKDDVKEAAAAVRLITESFIASADQLLAIKTKELMGKRFQSRGVVGRVEGCLPSSFLGLSATAARILLIQQPLFSPRCCHAWDH